jgi:biofilm PGA synthesis N-glycosyltransferase PgaC
LNRVKALEMNEGAALPAFTKGDDGFGCKVRFGIALLLAGSWAVFSIWLSQPWLADLGNLTHPLAALCVLTFIAYVPGFMNAFLLGSLVLRPGPIRRRPTHYPGISILVAAYQEEQRIADTLRALCDVGYQGEVEILVIDDGSTDDTATVVTACLSEFASSARYTLRLLRQPENGGKARALNSGLWVARHELVVTIDADTRLERGSLTAIVEHLTGATPDTMAIAGTVLVGNPRESWIAGAQEWDYFHGIAAVKRMQSMYNGTLVAQGAFSIYRRQALIEARGWPDTVGEDIVLTWALLKLGYRTGHAEDAIAWTHAPSTLRGLAYQRKRWARGMIEALAHHKALLVQPRLRTMFIWWNLLFITLDATFSLVFLPGLVLALFGIFWLAGPVTLLVFPLAAVWNLVIYRIQTRMLKREGVTMERSHRGFLLYVLIYPLVMPPVSLWGYVAEMAGRTKGWSGK